MKRLLFLLLPVAAFAQLPYDPIANSDGATFRTRINSNFSWLNTAKAGVSACGANQYAIQTTTAGVVCASLTNGQITAGLGFTPENAANKNQSGGYLGIGSDGNAALGTTCPGGAPAGSLCVGGKVYAQGVGAPGLESVDGTKAYDLPAASDTLVGRVSTDTLENKTIDTASNTVKFAGTTITGKQGNTGVPLMAGTVSGSASPLCTDASGNATTSGCPSASVSAGTGISVSGSTVSFNPTDKTAIWEFDAFCGGKTYASATPWLAGNLGWNMGVVGTGTPAIADPGIPVDVDHPCGVKLTTPASTSNGTYIRRGQFLSTMFRSGTFRPVDVWVEASMSGTANIQFYLNFFSNAAGASLPSTPTGCGIRYSTVAGDNTAGAGSTPAWVAFCGTGGSPTTGVVAGTVDANPHRFRFWLTAQGTANFSVDGGTATQISWTPGAGTGLYNGVQIANDGTSTTSSAIVYGYRLVITGRTVN